jgi:hypothetical protein
MTTLFLSQSEDWPEAESPDGSVKPESQCSFPSVTASTNLKRIAQTVRYDESG